MALTTLRAPWPLLTYHAFSLGTAVENAAGESVSAIGRIRLPPGSASKTISSAGGAIIWPTGNTATFANAGTTLRIGIQDVAAGVEDASWDTYAELVGGTDSLSTASWNNTPMESGSKTVSEGDTIAVVIEMTARGGADSVFISRATDLFPATLAFPYATTDTGTLAKASAGLICLLKFDDGTYGWIDRGGAPFVAPSLVITAASIASDTTPDEYAGLFKLPIRATVESLYCYVTNAAATDDFEIILYSDPLGTPAVIEAVAFDADFISGSAGASVWAKLSTPRTLEPNTWYAIALRPTTTNSIDFGYYNLGSGFDFIKQTHVFSDLKTANRTDQTGAFTETQAYHLPIIGISVRAIDDGLGVAEAAMQIGLV